MTRASRSELQLLLDGWAVLTSVLPRPTSLRTWEADVARRTVDEATADGPLPISDRDLVSASFVLPEPLALELLRRRVIRSIAVAELEAVAA